MFVINIIIKINNIINKRLNFNVFNVFNKSRLNFDINNKYRTIDKKITSVIRIYYNSNIKIHKINER